MKSDHTILTLKRSWLHHTDLEQEKLTTSYWPWTGEVDHIILTLNRRSWPHQTDLEQEKLIISYWPWTGEADHIILTLSRISWSYHTDLEQETLIIYWPWTDVDHIILTLNRRSWPHHTDLELEKLIIIYWPWTGRQTSSYWPWAEEFDLTILKRKQFYCIMLTLNRNNVLHHTDLQKEKSFTKSYWPWIKDCLNAVLQSRRCTLCSWPSRVRRLLPTTR